MDLKLKTKISTAVLRSDKPSSGPDNIRPLTELHRNYRSIRLYFTVSCQASSTGKNTKIGHSGTG